MTGEVIRVEGRRLGRLAPSNKPALRLADILKAVPAFPSSVDYITDVSDYGLYGNDKYGDCVTPDTMVLTADLVWVRAGELVPGDKLLAFDEEAGTTSAIGRNYKSAVVERTDIVKRPCYELEFDDGTIVRSSSGHRWLTMSTVQGELKCQRWCETKNLKVGPVRQSRVVKPLDVWETNTSYEAGYLAAAFDGEGNLEMGTTRNQFYANRLCFNQTDNEMLAETERCLKHLGFRYNHNVQSNGRALRVDGTPRLEKHRLAVSPRSEWLRFVGSIRPVRLLPKVDLDKLGRIHGDATRLIRKTFIGEQSVVMLDTTARTYFANGLASHNCGPVSVANSLKILSKIGDGAEHSVTLADVLDLYKRSGNPTFDPNDPGGPGDGGVDLQTMLEALHKGGIGGKKPVAFAKVDASNEDEVRAAIAYFAVVLFGVDLETAQQGETDHGGPWDYVPSSEWGGHAVAAAAYDAAQFGVVTWAEVIDATNAFAQHQLQEAWVVVWPEHLTHPGFLAGVDLGALANAYQALTGKTLPIPSPTPAPPPTPDPGAAPFPGALPAVARKIVEHAARKNVSVTQYQNHMWEKLFHLPPVTLDAIELELDE